MPLLTISWVITFIVCLWGTSLFISITCSNPPAPRQGAAAQNEQGESKSYQANGQIHQSESMLLSSSIRNLSTAIEKKRISEEGENSKKDSATQWGAVSDWVIVFLTIALICAAAMQWKVSDEMHEANKVQNRAYVSFSINFDQDPTANTPYILKFNWANRGKTPALDIGFRGGIWFIPSGTALEQYPIIAAGLDRARSNLFPDENSGSRGLGIEADTRQVFTSFEIDTVQQTHTHIFVIGLKIQYLDMFEKTHETHEYWAIQYQNGIRRVYIIPGKSVIT